MPALLAWLAAAIGDISPKVKAGLNWGVLASLVLALATRVTPDMLSWAGPYEPLFYAALPVVAGQIAAWIKSDPLRDLGKIHLAERKKPPVVNITVNSTADPQQVAQEVAAKLTASGGTP